MFIISLLFPTQKAIALNKLICILIYLKKKSACKFLRDLPLLTVDQLMYTCIIKALNKTLWLINALLARQCFCVCAAQAA